ncbi:MAG: hypothetical protein K9L28_03790 [Synergistales bacterium]|nr:hypothetical protein [Synergistales bacterium]
MLGWKKTRSKWLVVMVGLFVCAVLAGCPEEARAVESKGTFGQSAGENRQSFQWGEWINLHGSLWGRRIIPAFATRGRMTVVALDGYVYARAVVPDVTWRRTAVPKWFPAPGRPMDGGANLFSSGSAEGMPEGLVFSWESWRRYGGVWARRLVPAGPRRLGSVLLVDEEGKCYRKVVAPDTPLKAVSAPRWFPGLPEGRRFAACLAPDQQGKHRHGDGGLEIRQGVWYRRVIPPCSAPGDYLYYRDKDGEWFRSAPVDGAEMEGIDAPEWYSGS